MMAYIVGILQVETHIPLCNSLKEKRGVLLNLLNRIRKKLNVSASEIGQCDKWRAAQLGFAAGGTDRDIVEKTLRAVVGIVEQDVHIDVVDYEIEFV